MSDTFIIKLSHLPDQEYWKFSKSKFQEYFPDSFISRALQLDPETEEITLSNSGVSDTKVMEDALNYLDGICHGAYPYISKVDLSSAGKYLLIQLLEIVSHPKYDDFLSFTYRSNIVNTNLHYETILIHGLVHDFPEVISYLWERCN